MELNWILIWICGISSAVNLMTTLQNRQSPAWGWRAVLTGLLLLLAALWIVVPDYAGFIIGPIWFLFALLPSMLIKRIHRLLAERKHRRAYWTARVAGWLHPCDGWPQQTQLVQVLALYERGRTQQASALVDKLSRKPSSLGFSARLIQTQQSGDWQRLLDEINRRFLPTTVVRDETLFMARAQALGELGRPAEMIHTMADGVTGRAGLSSLSRAILLMRVAALSGQVAATERQLQALEHIYPPDVHEFWRLTAQQAAGNDGVREGFVRLQKTAGPFLQPMIARRLSAPLPVFDPATGDDDVRSILAAIRDRIRHEAQFADWIDDDRSKPWATWGIAVCAGGGLCRRDGRRAGHAELFRQLPDELDSANAGFRPSDRPGRVDRPARADPRRMVAGADGRISALRPASPGDESLRTAGSGSPARTKLGASADDCLLPGHHIYLDGTGTARHACS